MANATGPSRKRKRRRRWTRLAPLDLALMLATIGGGTLFVAMLVLVGFSQ